jgi:hypothetical protein
MGLGIYDEYKSASGGGDPYKDARAEIATAQGKINNYESSIASDQFTSKLGLGTPSFGSLAARPNLDTSQMGNIALHV